MTDYMRIINSGYPIIYLTLIWDNQVYSVIKAVNHGK